MEGNELVCFSSTLNLSVPVKHVLRVISALLLFFIGRFGWTSPFFANSNRIER